MKSLALKSVLNLVDLYYRIRIAHAGCFGRHVREEYAEFLKCRTESGF